LESNNIQVARINETHLQPPMKLKCSNHKRTRMGLRLNQWVLRNDHSTTSNLKQSEILLPHLQHVEAKAIQLNVNKESIILISIYNPPGRIAERDLHLLTRIGH
jgi:hypothetical protein